MARSFWIFGQFHVRDAPLTNRRQFLLVLIVSLALALAPSRSLLAQTAPQIGYLFPAGAQRGTQAEVTVGGKYMPGPCGVWVGGKGVRSEHAVTEGTLALIIDANAEPGPRPIRIHSVQGGSSPRSFVVGELPEVLEDVEAASQTISPGVTINGRLNPKGDIDDYELTLIPGQQVVCALAMRSLGSPGNTVLRLIDAQGRVVATGSNQQGLDPLLAWRCPTSGRYRLQVFDFSLAGGVDHVYRLTVTDGPYLDYAFPAGAQSGVGSTITLYGWNLPGDSLQHTINATGDACTTQLVGSTNRLTIPLSDLPELVEHEPNNSAETPQKIETSRVINGRFQQPGDEDVFEIQVTKGDRFVIRVESAALGFPTDAVLRVSSSEGKLIKETDDVGPSRDPEYLFTAAADGTYLLSLTERAARGGPRFIYRLHIHPPQPALRLTVKAAEFSVVPGETLTIPVRVNPLNGFDQEIELVAINLPAGVSVEPVKHTPKKAGDVKLEFQSNAQADFTSGPFDVIARTVSDEPSSQPLAVTRLATNTTSTEPNQLLWLAVSPKIPFELKTQPSILEAPRLAAFRFPVTVTRDENFQSAIRLVGVDRDRRGTVVPLSGQIAADADAGTIPLIIQSAAIEGTTHRCRVMGIAEVVGPDGKRHPVFHIAKGSMAMGCQPNQLTLTTSPARIQWQPGQPTSVTMTINRRVACGDVTISLLPQAGIKGVTAEPVTIAVGESQAEMKLEFVSDAVLPPDFHLQLQAESSRNGLPVYARAGLRILTR
jgi:hypothetical protein